MSGTLDCDYTPSQLAFIIGVPQPDICSWIENDGLKANRETRRITVKLSHLCDFLASHRELVGRIYFKEDLVLLNEIRQVIIDEIERIGF